MVFRIESDFIGTALSSGRYSRDRTDIIEGRLRGCQVKHFHDAMGVIGPEMIVGSNYDTARTHSLRRPARIFRQAYSMEAGNPSQEQIVFGVEHIDAGIARLAQVIPAPGIVDPADIETQRISRQINPANKF